eukprot:scaffold1929_cov376-Prasinococcus_capsulatus_cf.AAC.28
MLSTIRVGKPITPAAAASPKGPATTATGAPVVARKRVSVGLATAATVSRGRALTSVARRTHRCCDRVAGLQRGRKGKPILGAGGDAASAGCSATPTACPY